MIVLTVPRVMPVLNAACLGSSLFLAANHSLISLISVRSMTALTLLRAMLVHNTARFGSSLFLVTNHSLISSIVFITNLLNLFRYFQIRPGRGSIDPQLVYNRH